MRIHTDRSPITVGNSKGYQYQIFNWVDSYLVASQPNYKLNGLWTTSPFYMVREEGSSDGGASVSVRYKDGSTDFGTSMMAGCLGVPSAPSNRATDYVPSFQSQDQNLQSSFGAQGYARTRPGNPKASVAQFLAELRDLPKIPFVDLKKNRRRPKGAYGFKTIDPPNFGSIPLQLRDRAFSFKNLGSEYLNAVFGWKPFISDMRKMHALWHSIDKQMGKIIRENGRPVTRTATLVDDKSSVSDTPINYGFPFANVANSPLLFSGDGTSVIQSQTVTSRRVWYVGKYQYYIPDVGSSQWTARARLALFGALPTPEFFWEVTPWSWLIDWFSNVGDVVSNISPNAVDNLLVLNSFTMEHKVTQKIVSSTVAYTGASPLSNWGMEPCNHTFWSQYKLETKARSCGFSPLSVGSEPTELSSGQLAIIAALGLSRS